MLTIQRKRGTGRYVALTFIVVVILMAGFYAGITAISPASGMAQLTGKAEGSTLKKLAAGPSATDNRLYLPKINVDVAIGNGVGDARVASSSTPVPNADGTFILSAAQFQWGSTPQSTAERSPFYHLSQLAEGDQLVIDYGGQRYGYVVTTQPDTSASLLTLYATNTDGQKVGNSVQAKPVTNLVYRQS